MASISNQVLYFQLEIYKHERSAACQMKKQNSKARYLLSSLAHAPFSKQTLKANLADRVTQINAVLSAFYRFVFKNKWTIKTVVSQHYTSLWASDQQDNGVIVSFLPE